jgi:flavin reductase (DIM6/NTAB) family NADH-FMN oxidoreductase RutF
MRIDPARHSTGDNYKLLTNLVVPRPIAWVTSVSEGGVVNLAPFSFFNAVGAEPLFIVISIGRRDDGEPKDTARNIATGRDFVVNLVTEELLGAMNVSSVEFPPDESELVAAGVHAVASERVKSPRLAEATVSLECTLHRSIPLGTNTLFIGEVVMFHVADHLVDARLRVKGFAPIGRLGSPSVYCRTTDRFERSRIGYEEWQGLGEADKAAARS